MTDKSEQPSPPISDDALSELYRAMSTEQAPQSLDAAILQMAKQNQSELSTPFSSTSAKTWAKSWAVPVSLAAVIMLSVSIITTIDFQSPDVYLLPDTTSSSKDKSSLSVEQNNSTIDSLTEPASTKPFDASEAPRLKRRRSAHKEELTAARTVQDEADSNLRTPKMATKPSSVKKKEKLNKEKPSLTKRDNNLMANKPIPVTRAAAFDETISLDELALSERKEQRQQPSAKRQAANSLDSSMAKAKPTQTEAPKTIAETVLADDAEQSTQINRATAPAETRSLFSNTPKPADFSASPSKPKAQAFTLNQAIIAPPHPEQSSGAKINTQTNSQNNSQTTDCESLTHTQCLSSLQCVLKLTENELQCRRAENQCEKNFRQQFDSATQCTTKPDCQYHAGRCKCDEESGQCDCGENGPSMCQITN